MHGSLKDLISFSLPPLKFAVPEGIECDHFKSLMVMVQWLGVGVDKDVVLQCTEVLTFEEHLRNLVLHCVLVPLFYHFLFKGSLAVVCEVLTLGHGDFICSLQVLEGLG